MNLKELRYRLIGEDGLSGKLDKITRSGSGADTALGKLTRTGDKLKANFRSAATEVPGLGNAMRLLSNPVGLAAAAFVALGVGMSKAIKSATEFQHTFLQLKNLNLDKTAGQINDLQDSILKLSYKEGFDPNKVSNAFYDIQSATGKYGKEVEDITTKVGKFSQVVSSDFNTTVAGVSKAMKNYGFGAEGLDKYLSSSFKTVQYGIVTFDELAKVQTVYSGAAKASNQQVDTANKLFAIFTARTKSAEEAATLTKSAFTDLFKESTIKSMKSLGIDMFDEKGGAKQVDQVLRELNAKFLTAKTDRALNNMLSKFSGSEGLLALLSAATDKSGDLIRTLEGFDSAEFAFNKALENAKTDLQIINEQINNKLKTSWVELGNAILPMWMKVKNVISEVIDATRWWAKTLGHNFNALFNRDKYLDAYSSHSYQQVMESNQHLLGDKSGMSEDSFVGTKNNIMNRITELNNQLTGTKGKERGTIQGKIKAYWDLMDQFSAAYTGAQAAAAAGTTTTTTTTEDDEVSKMLNGVSGGGTQMKNITVNIQKLVEQINYNSSVSESANDVKSVVEELLIRAVAGAEQAL